MKALATAEEYDLEALMHGLLQQNLYIPTEIRSSNNRKQTKDFSLIKILQIRLN